MFNSPSNCQYPFKIKVFSSHWIIIVAKKAINENASAQIQWINNEVNKLEEEILIYKTPVHNYEGEIYQKLSGDHCDWNEILVLTNNCHN